MTTILLTSYILAIFCRSSTLVEQKLDQCPQIFFPLIEKPVLIRVRSMFEFGSRSFVSH